MTYPVVGSSRNSIAGLAANSMPIDTRLRCSNDIPPSTVLPIYTQTESVNIPCTV